MISFVFFSNLHYFNLWRILSRKKGGAALIPTLAVYNCTAAPTVIIATNCTEINQIHLNLVQASSKYSWCSTSGIISEELPDLHLES